MIPRATIILLLLAGCSSEPARPMAPELDPASTDAPTPAWTAAPNPLTRDVPEAPSAAAAEEHHHHHHAAEPADAGVPDGGP
jgi:hypothetical protein